MKIIDIAGSELKACVKFHYRGYLISASTIFKPHNVEISKQVETGVSPPLHSCDHIQDAIEWIDSQIKKKNCKTTLRPGADETLANECESAGSMMP